MGVFGGLDLGTGATGLAALDIDLGTGAMGPAALDITVS